MAEMIRTDRRINQAALAVFVLAAVLMAGILGGLVGARVASGTAAQAANVAPAAATVDWVKYGNAWQRQYEQQHPTTSDRMVQYGIDWQRQYEQQHPQN
jgi:hypothetical protein